MNTSNHNMVKAELDDLISKFFGAVSLEIGSMPAYDGIPALFIERGLLIKNVGPAPEISSIDAFIGPRKALVQSGTLTRFRESEFSESTVISPTVSVLTRSPAHPAESGSRREA